ncbi:hypothetical protein LRS05_06425 [Flavobacterium sp. J372]|nr:hypothetical protein [Flavobacterium sp. J372]
MDPSCNEFINYGEWLGAKREERFFTEPRILIRQIVSGNPLRLYCAYTEESLYYTQIGFGVISKSTKKFENKYLLAILNSSLINFYHKYKFLDIEKQLFQKVLIANAKSFPIKNIPIRNQTKFSEKVDSIITLTKGLFDHSQKFQRTIQRKFNLDDLPKKLQDWYKLPYGEVIKELAKKKVKLSLAEEAEWEEYFLTEQKRRWS